MFLRGVFSVFSSEPEQLPTHMMPAKEEEEEEDYDGITGYNEEGDDYLLAEEEEDEEVIEEGDDYEADSIANRLNMIMDDISPHYNEPRATIKHVYLLYWREIRVVNTDALEYLCHDTCDIRHARHGVFPRLVYSQVLNETFRPICSVRPIANVPDTFIVNKRLDFVYGRVIESALLNGALLEKAIRAFEIREDTLEMCHTDHLDDERVCPLDWVIYTKLNSTFYQFCCDQLVKHNPYINYQTSTTEYLKTERLSFYLVLFLCGEYIDGTPVEDFTGISIENGSDSSSSQLPHHQYGEINQWLKVPLWFLDVWLAGQLSTT